MKKKERRERRERLGCEGCYDRGEREREEDSWVITSERDGVVPMALGFDLSDPGPYIGMV